MDDMQRYREIRDNADPEDPAKQLLASLAASFDQALAEAIRLERQGKPGKVRALGFTAVADLLDEARCPSCDHLHRFHVDSGCWFTVAAGNGNVVCPCVLHRPAPRQGHPGGGGRSCVTN